MNAQFFSIEGDMIAKWEAALCVFFFLRLAV
jgi:hypothetical protein